MLAFAILTVFIAGLMVGRTPELLGKKIEPYEMKWSVMVCLATPIAILVGSGIAAIVPNVVNSLNNSGAHGFQNFCMLSHLQVVIMALHLQALMLIHRF